MIDVSDLVKRYGTFDDFSGDGIPLSPAQYAALLAQLTADGRTGADDYSRGGAVTALEQQFARLLGKEAAVFMPTGTLANHLAVRALCGERRRAIVQEEMCGAFDLDPPLAVDVGVGENWAEAKD